MIDRYYLLHTVTGRVSGASCWVKGCHVCTAQDTDKTDVPHAPTGAPELAGAGLLRGKGGSDDGGALRPSARWSIPAAPDPTSGTAVKMGRREAWARFLAYEARTIPSFPLSKTLVLQPALTHSPEGAGSLPATDGIK